MARPEALEWNDGDKNVGGMNEGAEAENSLGVWLRRGDKWGDSCRTRGRRRLVLVSQWEMPGLLADGGASRPRRLCTVPGGPRAPGSKAVG